MAEFEIKNRSQISEMKFNTWYLLQDGEDGLFKIGMRTRREIFGNHDAVLYIKENDIGWDLYGTVKEEYNIIREINKIEFY
jgi:hypothetical protein